MLKKVSLILVVVMLFSFTTTWAMSINITKDTEIHVSVSGFVGVVNLAISRFNMVIYSGQNANGIFDINLGEPLGTLDFFASDSSQNKTHTTITFDDTTIGYNKTVDFINNSTPMPTPSPTPTPIGDSIISLEFTVGKNYFYMYPLNSTKKTKCNMDVQTLFDASANRVLVPIRFFAQAAGYDVDWNEKNSQITLASSDTAVSMQVGSEYLIKDKEIIKMDEPLKIINARTYVPIRFIGEAFGYNVIWDGATQTATLSNEMREWENL